MNLKNKVIVITGGGRGIGAAIAMACSKAGARLVLFARSKQELEKTKAEIVGQTGNPVHIVSGNVTEKNDVDRLFLEAEQKFGPVYGLICSAGVYGAIGPFESTDFQEWRQATEINLFGSALCARQIIPKMKMQKEGRIVFVAGGGQAAMPNFTAYSTSKGGVIRLSESLAAELHAEGVFVNAIFPGPVNTKFLDDLFEAGPEKVGLEMYERAKKQKEAGGAPSEKAAALGVWLMSDESRGLFGKVLSAMWDPIANLENLESLSKSDIYTMKRVIRPDGGTR